MKQCNTGMLARTASASGLGRVGGLFYFIFYLFDPIIDQSDIASQSDLKRRALLIISARYMQIPDASHRPIGSVGR